MSLAELEEKAKRLQLDIVKEEKIAKALATMSQVVKGQQRQTALADLDGASRRVSYLLLLLLDFDSKLTSFFFFSFSFSTQFLKLKEQLETVNLVIEERKANPNSAQNLAQVKIFPQLFDFFLTSPLQFSFFFFFSF